MDGPFSRILLSTLSPQPNTKPTMTHSQHAGLPPRRPSEPRRLHVLGAKIFMFLPFCSSHSLLLAPYFPHDGWQALFADSTSRNLLNGTTLARLTTLDSTAYSRIYIGHGRSPIESPLSPPTDGPYFSLFYPSLPCTPGSCGIGSHSLRGFFYQSPSLYTLCAS